MKLLVVLSVIACGYAAKLDRTYLPPASAATAGGSPGSLNAPVGPSGSGGFGQSPSGFGQPAANSGFGQPAANTGFGQPASFGSSNGPAGKSLPRPAFGSQPSGQYGQPGAPSGGFDAGFGAVAQNFGPGTQDYQTNQPQRSQAASEQGAQILRSDSQNDGETFSYSFETSNGISAEESGVATNGVQAQGAFSYSDDDGQNFRVTYTADENGYQPQGDHLPTPHPIPEDILKSIEKNAQAAAAGTQEGAYNPNEDNTVNAPTQYNYNAPTSYNQGPSGSGSSQQGPSQLYGAPNAGSAPRSQPGQGFQPQGPSQQYGAPNAAGAPRSQPGQGFQPQGPSQQYGAPNAAGAPRSQPGQGFQPQGPSQQYGAPNAAGAPRSQPGQGFQPQGLSQQYGALNAGSARPTSFGKSQVPSQSYGISEASDGPQANNFGQNQVPSQQYGAPSRPDTNGGSNSFVPLKSGSNGFTPSGPASQPRPNQYQAPQSGFPSAGRPQGRAQAQPQDESGYQYDRPQGSFGQASNGRSSNQGPAGQYRPQAGAAQPSGPHGSQGSFSIPNGPSGRAQGSNGPNPQGSFGPSSGANAGSFGPSAGSQGPSSFGPSGSNGQSSFGPSSNGNGFGRQQGSFSGAGAMADSGYTYNRPGSQSGTGPQAGFGSQPQFGANAGSRPGQNFSGPRQPPSFSEEEGYKY